MPAHNGRCVINLTAPSGELLDQIQLADYSLTTAISRDALVADIRCEVNKYLRREGKCGCRSAKRGIHTAECLEGR